MNENISVRIPQELTKRRDLKKIHKKEAALILNAIERSLSKSPRDNPLLRGPFAGLRKWRIGDYPVVYAVLGNDIMVLRIGHRTE